MTSNEVLWRIVFTGTVLVERFQELTVKYLFALTSIWSDKEVFFKPTSLQLQKLRVVWSYENYSCMNILTRSLILLKVKFGIYLISDLALNHKKNYHFSRLQPLATYSSLLDVPFIYDIKKVSGKEMATDFQYLPESKYKWTSNCCSPPPNKIFKKKPFH